MRTYDHHANANRAFFGHSGHALRRQKSLEWRFRPFNCGLPTQTAMWHFRLTFLMRKLLIGLFIVTLVAVPLWVSDRITLQGERTIFTARCEQGAWQGARCTGRLVPGERYAFRASARRHEVIYWIRNSDAPSGKYTDCTVADRDNWSCNVQANQQPSIAYEMIKGRPTRTGVEAILPFHAVPKWKWWLMRAGFTAFTDADE